MSSDSSRVVSGWAACSGLSWSGLCMRRCRASGARWTLAATLLVPLVAAERGVCALPAVLLITAGMALATLTKRDLKRLSTIVPPPKTSRGRRERNIRSFADFMAMWMTFLSHLVAVAVCARILSATADHVTDGKTRRWIFGYETRALGEPWPDVLGVTVIMVVCGMFMCGLEANIMFSTILMILVYFLISFFTIVGTFNLNDANLVMPKPMTIYEVIAASAPLAYSFNIVFVDETNGHYSKKPLLFYFGFQMIAFCGLAFFYTNMIAGKGVDSTLPVTTLIEGVSAKWACPLVAAITVATVSLSLTELCPLLFIDLVALASPEWKVLTRSMTYESATTGSPVLAVFTAGSLAAILAFACPLSHMVTLMNGSHLVAVAIRAFHYIIMRCVPTKEQIEAGDVEYKRLGREGPSRASKPSCTKRGPWFIPSALRHTHTLESIKSKIIAKEKEDRECLLLDEYSGYPTEEMEQMTSCASSTREIPAEVEGSGIEESDDDISSGDDSTDIDAVVKEYKDTIQVVTATPVSEAPAPPCVAGARWAAAGATLQVLADAFIAVAVCNEALTVPMLATGLPLLLCGAAICWLQPSHELPTSTRWGQSVQGSLTLLAALLFLTPLLLDSWPAIVLFAAAGVVIYARCDRWCGDLAMAQARSALESRKLLQMSAGGPLAGARITHVDTVYIATR